jgi:hypothetical protein
MLASQWLLTTPVHRDPMSVEWFASQRLLTEVSPYLWRLSFLSRYEAEPHPYVQIQHNDYHLLGDDNHHSHRRGNLKSYINTT